jgi:transposase, IS30 family
LALSESLKVEFFRLLDRGGTVRAAAEAVGVSADIGYRWCRQVGVSSPRGRARRYTAEEKAEFFRLLQLRGNVSAVARELGFHRVTCYQWAHKAGIFTSTNAETRRQAYLRLRADGIPRADAARRVGVSKRSGQDWDKGIRQFVGGRIYPDGRVVRYGPAAPAAETLPAMKPARRAYIHGEKVDLELLERSIDARFLSLAERERIHDLHRRGISLRAIARALGRAPSTISRELARNSSPKLGYLPYAAHRAAVARRPRPKQRRLLVSGPLRDYVVAGLARRWSPEQISHRLVKDFADEPRMRVATETIYQAIYVQARGALKKELIATLRRGRVARKPRREPTRRTPRFVTPMVPIRQRPTEADDRTVPGHWEGDLIVGSVGRSAIGTLVERCTRYVMLVHLDQDRSAVTVRQSLVETMQDLPASLRRTLTWDQGAEMSEHHAFKIATDIDVFFCDPARPWQRGTNENTNGLLRQYFPKSSDLSQHSRDDLLVVADELNTRPRKSLDWDTPAERLDALLTSH